jgi:hypothetical protein
LPPAAKGFGSKHQLADDQGQNGWLADAAASVPSWPARAVYAVSMATAQHPSAIVFAFQAFAEFDALMKLASAA